MKKSSTYLIALCGILWTILLIYSCNNDEYNYANENSQESGTRAFTFQTRHGENALIDSIATSDEFRNFEMTSELLADKFQAYTSTLSEEEYDKFMENLNDDDYMKDFIQKANLEKELQQMDEAKENLIRHTGFSKLNEEERNQLFRQYAESRELSGKKLLKTRTEGDTNSCEATRQVAYTQAKTDYDNAIVKCRTESSSNYCYMQASASYQRNKDYADKEYEACIQKK